MNMLFTGIFNYPLSVLKNISLQITLAPVIPVKAGIQELAEANQKVVCQAAGPSCVGRLIAALLLLFCASLTFAQSPGSLFTYVTEGAVHLRWNAPVQRSYTGFYVERQAVGGTWQRLNQKAVTQVRDVAEIRRLLGYNAEAFLTFFDPKLKTIDAAQFNKVMGDEIARNLIQLFSVKIPQFGEVLGEIYRDRDVQSGTAFNYRIIGEIDGQTLTWAQTKAPVTHGQPDRIPVPQELQGEGIDSTALLTWAHNAEFSRSGELVGYRVYRAVDPSGPFELESIDTVIPTKIDGKLPSYLYANDYLINGTPYWFKITGVNVLGFESAFSETIKVIPKDEVPPKPPTGFKGRLQVESSLLQWKPNLEPDLEGYRLYRSVDASGPYEIVWPKEEEPLTPMISHVDKDVPEGSTFWYQVTAVDFSGNESRPSDAIQIFREDVTPPAQVQEVKAVAVGEGKDKGVHLSWAANNEKDLQGYLVERTTRVEGKGEDAKVTTDFYVETSNPLQETRYIDPVPEDSESRYAYRIVAVDQVWNRSEPSETVIAQMPDIVPPTRPALAYVRLEKDKVHIGWSPNVEEDLAGYQLSRALKEGDFSNVNQELIGPSQANYFDRPKESNRVYRYRLTALDETGNVSEPSKILSVKVLDLVGPDAPAIDRIEVEDNGLALFWTSKERKDIETLILYRTQGKGSKEKIISYLAPDTEEFLDTEVENEQSYTYFLRATDERRNLGEQGKSGTGLFKVEGD